MKINNLDKLGIIICNFNKKEYLSGCINSLLQAHFDNINYDIIVVDNASTDGSGLFVKANYPHIILLENATNTGGSGGFDRGIRYCIEKNYDYVALLDNDILLEENTLINLLNYLKNHPKVGIVGSKICTMDNPDILQEMGSFIDFEENFNIKTPFKGYKDTNNLPEIIKCDYVPACCLITTQEVLKKVGSFNTDHFIYWDDMDWCTRVKKAGWEIHAINSARVFHKMGSNDNKNTFGMYYYHRNRILYFLKYLDETDFLKFCHSISNWLLNLTFFSNLKQDYNTPLVAWLILDDIINKNLGKQDKRILDRTNSKEQLLKDNDLIFDFSNDYNDSELKAKVKAYLENLNIIPVQTRSNKKCYKVTPIDHILKINEDFPIDENMVYIDNYLNILFTHEINEFKLFYSQFTDMFNNIFSPIIIEKLTFGRKLFYENSNN